MTTVKKCLVLLVMGVLAVESRPEVGSQPPSAGSSRQGKAQSLAATYLDSANLPSWKAKEYINGGEIPVHLVYDGETEAVVREVSGEAAKESLVEGSRKSRETMEGVDAEELNRGLGIEGRGRDSVEVIVEKLKGRARLSTGEHYRTVLPYYPGLPIMLPANYPLIFDSPVWPGARLVDYGHQPELCKRYRRGRRDTKGVDHSGPQIMRLRVRGGGVAIAGPGGIATAGDGGTAIVGPGGTAYTTKDGIAVVGPGGKLIQVPEFLPTEVVKARSGEDHEVFHPPKNGRLVATGPYIYYNTRF